jgi:ubiquinone/menaquinone biosynthesis C-methylase UbiE
VKIHFSDQNINHKSVDLKTEIAKYGGDNLNKLVLGYKANNEALPFKDAQFECYIAGLSL